MRAVGILALDGPHRHGGVADELLDLAFYDDHDPLGGERLRRDGRPRGELQPGDEVALAPVGPRLDARRQGEFGKRFELRHHAVGEVGLQSLPCGMSSRVRTAILLSAMSLSFLAAHSGFLAQAGCVARTPAANRPPPRSQLYSFVLTSSHVSLLSRSFRRAAYFPF